ncbi:MAG: hypothetical protein NZ934_00095 [Hadesarchaea archaeon]|nr:hypothetical protein [Hadesarchaea archaeon]
MPYVRSRRRGRDAVRLRVMVALVAIAAFVGGTIFGAEVLSPGRRPSTSGHAWATSTQEVSIRIAAVRSDGPGVICGLTVTIKPGTGRIFTDTRPLVGLDFQDSERIAVKVAAGLTDVALNENGGLVGADVFFAVSPPAEGSVTIQAVDGPSAGAAMTVAIIAAIENRKVKEDVIITGTIREDGSIGAVGGIFEKAKAANDYGARLFLVPKGQSVVIMYREVVRQAGPFKFVTYEPVVVDLNSYAENVGWGIRIQEVSTIQEAVDLMLEARPTMGGGLL